MAIYVNGIKVAGRGVSGKSPYRIAVGEGYTGTEAEFNAQLAAIGEAVAGFDELSRQVDSAKAEVEAAVSQANVAVQQALQDIAAAKTGIERTVSEATQNINGVVASAESQIDQKVADALASIPDSENLVTKLYLQEQLANVTVDLTGYATEDYVNTKTTDMATQTWVNSQISSATASIVTDIWYYGASAPSNTKLLWIDSNTTSGGLKFYKNATDGWVHVPVAWQ